MFNQKAQSPVKIGARVLKFEQAEQLLPGYSRIADQIELFREEAKKVRETRRKANQVAGERYDRYGEFYSVDNTISILGGRGSGKTSVMLTFKHDHSKLNNDKKIDIILPLIVPEDMSEANDTLGWFLGYLGEEVDDIEKNLKDSISTRNNNSFYKDQFDKCLHKENSPLKDSYNRLIKNYVTRKNTYYEIIQGKNIGKAEYIRENEAYVHTDQRFGIEFNHFIDQLIEIKKQMNPNQEIEPLVMVFFDDVDISAERCPEALETIRKYFSHPNIVTFVSGDYNVFSEAMTIEFMRRENIEGILYQTVFTPTDKSSLLKGKNMNGSSALNQRKIRSQDYLKKVLPPSFRFEMKKMGNQEKANFSYPIAHVGEIEAQDIMLKTLLSEISFLKGEAVIEELPIPYFRIFDENPRGLINPFYFLYQKNYQKENIWNETDLMQFFNVLVNSSLRLREYRQDLEKTVQISLDTHVASIDYKYISSLYEHNSLDEGAVISEEEISEDMITLYLFADFFELLFKKARLPEFQVVNKEGVLVDILNKPHNIQEAQARIYPDIKREEKLIKIYQKLSEAISFHNLKELFISKKTSLYFEVKYYQIMGSIDSESDIINLFRETFEHDSEWVKQHVDFLFEKGKSFIELRDSNIDEFFQNRIFSRKMDPHQLNDGLTIAELNDPNTVQIKMIKEVENISSWFPNLDNQERVEEIIDDISIEMLKLEREVEESNIIEYTEQYERSWNQLVAVKIANEYRYEEKKKKKNDKLLFENIITIFDDLIEQAKWISSVKKDFNFPLGQIESWNILSRQIAPSFPLGRELRDIVFSLRNNIFDLETYQKHVERVVVIAEKERKRRSHSSFERFFSDLEILANSVLSLKAEEQEEEDLAKLIRKESLLLCISKNAQFYVNLKAWVKNQDIQENVELSYFRNIKEQLRNKFENKRASFSRFENYIIQKLEK
ncbi:hypothetical protein ACFWMS_22090 [Peribacillus butanolivorans]|uniref:hypothetical protein n=1 Tax=Peribacillus butanolivorans TaxID=421767 RepID=UPI00365E9C89